MSAVGPDGPTPPDRPGGAASGATGGRHARGDEAVTEQQSAGESPVTDAPTRPNPLVTGVPDDLRQGVGSDEVTAEIPVVPAEDTEDTEDTDESEALSGPARTDGPVTDTPAGSGAAVGSVTDSADDLVTGDSDDSVTDRVASPTGSLSPSERVIPSWTDPTVRRASTLIGGPLGRHASVGRARIFTPLRVALLMGIAVLICGWLFKSPCIQQGADGGLNQGGQRPWITGCYNDVVPLYGGRGLNDPNRDPYSYVWAENRPADADHTSAYTARVYRPDQVSKSGNQLVADDAGSTVALGNGTLVGDPESGYSEVHDGTLVPVPDGQTGTIRYLEYPVLTGYFMWGVAALTSGYLDVAKSTHLVPVPLDVAAYFSIGAILLGLMYLWVVACTAKIARRRIWDTAIMCLSPLLIVQAFTNWDLLAIGFTGGAMLAWARRRPVLAGILLGLGTAAKLYPVLLLGPLLVLCLRSGKMTAWVKAAVSAVIVWVAVNLPIYLAYPHAWVEFYTMNTDRGPEWDSWYFLSTVVGNFDPWRLPDGNATSLLNYLSLGLFAVACVAIGWFALSAQRRPRFAQLAFLVIAAFLLTNKVWSPQYSLWLVPLVALALPRWRRVLPWQFAEVCVWLLLMLSFDTDASRNLSIHPFAVAAVVRDILLIALVVRVIREILRPEWDLIRTSGDDDPSGGVLEDAADRFTVPSLPTLWRRLVGSGRASAAPDGAGPGGSGALVGSGASGGSGAWGGSGASGGSDGPSDPGTTTVFAGPQQE